MFKKANSRPDFIAMEKKHLKRWDKDEIVKKYLERNDDSDKRFSFIDGPITANNPMGLHHAWGRTYKDVWQRYKNMKGYKQRFQNGFDCQGLWVEVEVEKDLGFNSKKDIEDYGKAKFTKKCKSRVKKFSGIQTEQSKRLGMFMDWENSYYTMSETNNLYIWKFLKKCNEEELIYKNHAASVWCPRCETGLSQHEQADGYQMIKDTSVYIKFPLKDKEDEYFLVWTTTPWTISANVLLAVNPEYDYVKADADGESYYLAKESAERLGFEDLEPVDAEDLLDLEYEALYDIPVQEGIKHYVVEWDLVDPEEGTGIVHIAPGCGAEDFELGQELDAPVIAPLNETGHFKEGFGDLTGEYAHSVTGDVIGYLKDNDYLFKTEKIEHSYPHCWRCKTKCLFRLQENWFINIDKVRGRLKKAAGDANWLPDYAGARMQDWLNNMEDWMISRQRFYGLSLPFYECSECGELTVVGSKDELSELALEPKKVDELPSLHRPWIDDIKIKCPKCGEEVQRIEDVGDCWLDAGVVPFSTLKYFEDKDYWKKWYPAEFISEMIEQVRLWFYSMLVYGVLFEDSIPYKNVLTYGEVRDENGERFSKSKPNYIPFDQAADKIGSDVVRWLYLTQSVGTNVKFGWNTADETRRTFYIPFWNSYVYFTTYANLNKWTPEDLDLENLDVMDKWILSRLNEVVNTANEKLDQFDAATPTRKLEEFVQDISTWYIRRSRNRFKEGDNNALSTLYYVLKTMSKLLAPFVPFVSEEMFLNLKTEDEAESVHLTNYPELGEKFLNEKLMRKMKEVREIAKLGQSARVEASIKVRQPLAELRIKGSVLENNLLEIVKDELNVEKAAVVEELPEKKYWNTQESKFVSVALNTRLTPELQKKGLFRNLVRKIQRARKKAGLKIGEPANIKVSSFKEGVVDLVNEENDKLKEAVYAQTLDAKTHEKAQGQPEISVTIE
jgi:isoleucyl-tRNA synthetase